MCMLTFIPEGEYPDTEALSNGATFNNDGHGYAIVVPGRKPRLIVRHGLKAGEMIERFAKDRAKHMDGPAMFHSRFGTSGNYGKYNCHPFNLAGDRRTVVAHNGVLPAHMQPGKGEKRCDTRLAVETRFATAYGHLAKSKSRKRLANAIGRANKLVILSVDPAYRPWYIINESSGVWEDGIWYSNYDFEGWYRYYTPTAPEAAVGVLEARDGVLDAVGDLGTDCDLCLSRGTVDLDGDICTMCHSCMTCEEHYYACLCWSPASLGSIREEEDQDALPF